MGKLQNFNIINEDTIS